MGHRKRFVIATAIVVAVIVYGSLYPFMFRQPVDGLRPALRILIDSWREPSSLSNLIANILFYLPFGFCAVLALGRGPRPAGRIVLVTLVGALLSVAMELTQYFDKGRVTSANDVYANAAGALLGAIAGSLMGRKFRWPLIAEVSAHQVPVLLLGAWIGYRLYPYVPTIDLHKYWDALKPVILYPRLTGYDLFRYTIMWLGIGALIEAIVDPKRLWLLFPLFIGAALVGKIVIVGTALGMAEIAGAVLAIVVFGLLALNPIFRAALIALTFCVYVIAERLEPFRFGATPGAFGWIPFLGFMSGSLEIDVLSFLEKFFLYGSSIWLLAKAGLRLGPSTLVMAVLLFVTSEAERWLPNRSAEITDAVFALIIGAVFALIGTRPIGGDNQVTVDQPQGWRLPGDRPH